MHSGTVKRMWKHKNAQYSAIPAIQCVAKLDHKCRMCSSPNFHVTVDVCGIFGPDSNFVSLHANVHHRTTNLFGLSVECFANQTQHLHQRTETPSLLAKKASIALET